METTTGPRSITLFRVLSLLWFSVAATLLILVLGHSFWILRFAQDESVRVWPLVIVLFGAPLLGLVSMIYGLVRRPPAKLSLSGAMLCSALLVLLATDDAQRPQAPDFSPLATADSPESCVYHKMAKGAPGNITTKIRVPAQFTELFISAKPDELDAFVTRERTRILEEWIADSLGQAWLNELAALPETAGALVHASVDAPILAFQPSRAIVSRRLAYACLLASEGRNADAADHVCLVLQAIYALKRIGVGAVDQMIATVLEEKTYEVIRYLVERIPIDSRSGWHHKLAAVLRAAPKIQFVAERMILGDSQTLRDVTDRIRKSTLSAFATVPVGTKVLPCLTRFVIHPNRVEREILELHRELSALVGARKFEEAARVEAAFLEGTKGLGALRNPGGQILASLAVPAFHKAGKSIWEAEDSRLELLARIGNASASYSTPQAR